MEKKISILRGINVGGKRKILMADLKALCEQLQWTEVTTYIQSGNIIFTSAKLNADLERELTEAIKDQFGFELPVMVKNAEELEACVNRNPFYKQQAEVSQLHLTFLKEEPLYEDIAQLKVSSVEQDQYFIHDREVFILCEGKYHESKLTNNYFEKKLKVTATTRNWKTILKLIELSRVNRE